MWRRRIAPEPLCFFVIAFVIVFAIAYAIALIMIRVIGDASGRRYKGVLVGRFGSIPAWLQFPIPWLTVLLDGDI